MSSIVAPDAMCEGQHVLPAVRALLVVYLGITALVVVASVFAGLPQRWWPVDVPATLLSALCLGTAWGLARRTRWSSAITRVCAGCMLATGLLLCFLLVTSVATLRGIAGPLGQGGVLVFLLVIALVLPYLVVMPALMLLWVGPRQTKKPDAS